MDSRFARGWRCGAKPRTSVSKLQSTWAHCERLSMCADLLALFQARSHCKVLLADKCYTSSAETSKAFACITPVECWCTLARIAWGWVVPIPTSECIIAPKRNRPQPGEYIWEIFAREMGQQRPLSMPCQNNGTSPFSAAIIPFEGAVYVGAQGSLHLHTTPLPASFGSANRPSSPMYVTKTEG